VVAELLEAGSGTAVGGFEHRDPTHVHVSGGRFHLEERRIERRETLRGHLFLPIRGSSGP
jgi:hypothetical protein